MPARRWSAAHSQCSAAYESTFDPKYAAYAAHAAYFDGKLAIADQFAGALLGGPHAADGELVLGTTALERGEHEIAHGHLVRASTLHEREGRNAELARAEFKLTNLWFNQGDYGLALESLRLTREAAQRANDAQMIMYADLATTDLYRGLGDLLHAERSAGRALENAKEPDDQVFARFKRGTVRLEAGHLGMARSDFEWVITQADTALSRQVPYLRAAQVNLAFIERRQGRLAEALERMERHQHELDEVTFRVTHGIILGDLGRLAAARADLRIAEAAAPPGERAWWVPYHLARVEERAGQPDVAIAAYQRAIAQVEQLAARSGTYGARVIATHRLPYLHLIGLYAARGEWPRALEVIAALDAQAFLDSRDAASEPAEESDSGLLLPAPARPALGDASTVVDAWRGRRLVMVVPGGDRMWRLVLDNGRLVGRDLGEARRLEELAQTLSDAPDDVTAGKVLGETLLAELPAGATIDLLVVGPLAKAPLGALRRGERFASEELRIVRVPGILPRIAPHTERWAWLACSLVPGSEARGCARPIGAPRAVVLGDPRGNLPAAATEAMQVAAHLGVTARLGAAATRDALLGAGGAELLHVSAHSDLDGVGGVLELAGGVMTAAEIGKLAAVPRRVVLASCAGSAGTDDIGDGSLARAFLDAGVELVVATKWTVEDPEAAQLVSAFYEAGGARDPIGALGVAQRRLSGSLKRHTWAAFEVFSARPVLR